MNRAMILSHHALRALGPMLAAVYVLATTPVGQAVADAPQHSSCTREGVSREVELRMAAGVERVCDVIDRRPDEGTEERALHVDDGKGFCRAQFDDRVQSLRNDGWRCVDAGTTDVPAFDPVPRPNEPTRIDTPFALAYRERCETALASRYTDPKTICSCAVRTMNGAGFIERDYELLAAPYGDGERELAVHAAGLLYGLGTVAIDALERCGTRP